MAENENASEVVTKKPRAKKVAAATDDAPVKKARVKRIAASTDEVAPVAAKPRKASTRKTGEKTDDKMKVSVGERHEMVSVAAYFIAERRGFLTGYEHDDWLAAEAEVDARIELI